MYQKMKKRTIYERGRIAGRGKIILKGQKGFQYEKFRHTHSAVIFEEC